MLVLITYDVSTIDESGKHRLRNVAKYCQKYGQRVQNSVFECIIDESQYATLQHQLLEIIDCNKDSLRFYKMGNKYKSNVDHFGVKPSYCMEDVFMV